MIKWKIVIRKRLSSTQASATRLALNGAEEGIVLVAETQYAGTGRLGRMWYSPHGGLYMSLILRPVAFARLGLLPLLASSAVVTALKDVTGLLCNIRWPNDVMVGSKKVAGVIASSHLSAERPLFTIIGVGINVNRTPKLGHHADKSNVPTSIMAELGRKVNIDFIMYHVLDVFSDLYERWSTGLDLVPLLEQYFAEVNGHVMVKMTGSYRASSYRVIGLSPEGGLLVDPGRKEIRAETIEWLRQIND